MSDIDLMQVTKSFTIRLSADDQAALTALCARYGLNRPNSLRRALREALAQRAEVCAGRQLAASGLFVPVPIGDSAPFTIRFKTKRA